MFILECIIQIVRFIAQPDVPLCPKTLVNHCKYTYISKGIQVSQTVHVRCMAWNMEAVVDNVKCQLVEAPVPIL